MTAISPERTGQRAARLDVRAVQKAYGGVKAVADVTLTCGAGEILAVIGPNGAGKTTLFGLISGDVRCDGGRITLDDREIHGLSAARRARIGLSRTFQVAHVMDRMTVHENLLLAAGAAAGMALRWTRRAGRADAAAARVRPVADRLDLARKAGLLAGGLSQGERKRLDIGMALVQQPSLLLLDEPTAGMGAEDVAATTATLAQIHREDPELSMVFTAHDMSVVFGLAQTVALMVEGRLVMTGTPETIRGSSQAQEAYLGHSYGGQERGDRDRDR
ncbi:MAG TPA: ATP-binding cassette domain-containing protein [Streptosporangiaceae bacterium]|nr:ATP-binding cassette domain-containing protein [Streptosporangiaceae bacterium]